MILEHWVITAGEETYAILTLIIVLEIVEIDRYAPTGFRGPDSAPGQGIEVQP